MAGKRDEPIQPVSLRDVKFTDAEKRKLFIMGGVVLAVFAASILIVEYIFGAIPLSSTAYYPGNCGTYVTGQQIDNCLVNYATSTSNVSVCSYINDGTQESCYLDLALKTQNASTCALIPGQSALYTDCILRINQKDESMGLCNNLSMFPAESCMYNVSVSANFSGVGSCNQLSNLAYRTECENLYYYSQAQSTKNPGACRNLESSINSTVLYFISSNHTNSSQNLLDIFYSSSLNITPSQYCYYETAISSHNSSICKDLGTPFSTSCSYAIMQYNESLIKPLFNATNATAACGSYAGNSNSLGVCDFKYLSHQAITSKSVAPCGLLNTSIKSDECILYYSINTTNTSNCHTIVNSSLRSICDFIGNVTNKTG